MRESEIFFQIDCEGGDQIEIPAALYLPGFAVSTFETIGVAFRLDARGVIDIRGPTAVQA